MRAGWADFKSFQHTALDFAQFSRTRLTIPVLSIVGEKATGELLAREIRLVPSDVTALVLPNTGHWAMEERPNETTAALMNFLLNPARRLGERPSTQ